MAAGLTLRGWELVDLIVSPSGRHLKLLYFLFELAANCCWLFLNLPLVGCNLCKSSVCYIPMKACYISFLHRLRFVVLPYLVAFRQDGEALQRRSNPASKRLCEKVPMTRAWPINWLADIVGQFWVIPDILVSRARLINRSLFKTLGIGQNFANKFLIFHKTVQATSLGLTQNDVLALFIQQMALRLHSLPPRSSHCRGQRVYRSSWNELSGVFLQGTFRTRLWND